MDTQINQITPNQDGQTVTVHGWLHEIRDLNKVKFLLIRDKTGIIQCVAVQDQLTPDVFSTISKILNESVLTISGTIKANPQAKTGVEILIKELNVLSKADSLPIQVIEKGIETDLSKRLDYRFLDTRKPRVNAIFQIRSNITKQVVNFFDKNGFTNITTPKLTVIGVESGAEMFPVIYFEKKVFLSQSPQLYKQMFVVGGFEKVYEIGTVFRAEQSRTTRHLTEFTGVDMEMGFIKDENDIMDVVEKMLKQTIKGVKKECAGYLNTLGITLNSPKKIPRVSLQRLRELLQKHYNKTILPDEDPDAEAEKLIGEIALKEWNSEFIFCTRYPITKRPFYHMRHEDDPRTTKSFDLLWRGVEIATGAQREHRLEILRAQAKEKGINLDEEMPDYANIFKYGVPPHGGVGFGLDRITQRMLNLDNVREAILLPRDPDRTRP